MGYLESICSSDVRNSLLDTGRVSNENAILLNQRIQASLLTDLEKGDQHDVERRCN